MTIASFSEDELCDYLEKTPLVHVASHTITKAEKLKEDLLATAKKGYSVENPENEEHVISLGAPVYDSNDNICAAIATMMLALNITESDIRTLGMKLKNTAAQASLALGAKVR